MKPVYSRFAAVLVLTCCAVSTASMAEAPDPPAAPLPGVNAAPPAPKPDGGGSPPATPDTPEIRAEIL